MLGRGQPGLGAYACHRAMHRMAAVPPVQKLIPPGYVREYMSEYTAIEIHESETTFEIRFDRPHVLNAIDDEFHQELTTVFKDAYDSSADVVVVTGNGDAFSAGGDIGAVEESMGDDFRTAMREGEEIIEDIVNLEKPIIAKINGDAMGLGATLALFCDITVASEDARIADPHVKVGLVAGDGGAAVWPLLVGINTAKEFLMTGQSVTGSRAAEMGLVNRAVPADELDDEVDELVQELSGLPQTAVRYTKVSLNSWLQMGVQNTLRESLALEGLSANTPEHEARAKQFMENADR